MLNIVDIQEFYEISLFDIITTTKIFTSNPISFNTWDNYEHISFHPKSSNICNSNLYVSIFVLNK
jgi:hypothetical protein